MREHLVERGESVYSIAKLYGFEPRTLWDDPGNQRLRDSGRTLELLKEGDRLSIPEREDKQIACALDRRHRFRCRGRRATLRLRFCVQGRPRAGEPYRLRVDERDLAPGTLDDEGALAVSIPADAVRATVWVGSAGREKQLELLLEDLDPISDPRGVQQRLNALGFDCGPEDGDAGPRTRAALRAFQRLHGLEVSGQADDDTRQRLQELHEGRAGGAESGGAS